MWNKNVIHFAAFLQKMVFHLQPYVKQDVFTSLLYLPFTGDDFMHVPIWYFVSYTARMRNQNIFTCMPKVAQTSWDQVLINTVPLDCEINFI